MAKFDQKLVTPKLGLKLNERLRKLFFSRIEYGYKDDLCVTFEIENIRGGFRIVTEEEFALDDFKANKNLRRTIGIFGSKDPRKVLDAIMKRYSDATIMMRKDPPAPSRKRSK